MENPGDTRTAVAVTEFDNLTVLGVAVPALDRLPLPSPVSHDSGSPAGRRFPARHCPARIIPPSAATLRARRVRMKACPAERANSMNRGVHEWLLEGEPWVRYRTLTDLLHKGRSDRRVVAARTAVQKHPLITGLFGRRNADGYWGSAKDIHTWWPKKDTTFWVLGVLADFGLSKDDDRVARACEYVFGIQLEPGGFGWDPPTRAYECHTAILTETLAKLGYTSDRRLTRAYDWLASRQRLDGGFWCKNTGQPRGSKRREPSCAFATLLVLGALAQIRALRTSDTAKRAVEFLLGCWDKRGKVKYAGHDSQIGSGFDRLHYPFTDYRILKYLDVLSQFVSARQDRRVEEMLELVASKRDRQGRYTPEAVHRAWSQFDFGQKKVPSRWITFLALRILARLSRRQIARAPS
jgi:hypothetical protein